MIQYYWHPSKTEIEEKLLLISFNQRLFLKFKNTPYKSIEGLTTLAFVRFFPCRGGGPLKKGPRDGRQKNQQGRLANNLKLPP